MNLSSCLCGFPASRVQPTNVDIPPDSVTSGEETITVVRSGLIAGQVGGTPLAPLGSSETKACVTGLRVDDDQRHHAASASTCCEPASGVHVEAANGPLSNGELAVKYVFLIRHAESDWNKMLGGQLRRAPFEVRKRDHKLSKTGIRQADGLRERIREAKGSNGSFRGVTRDFDHKFFDTARTTIYSSPLLRALQTTQRVLPGDDTWGTITLLKDAREWLHHEVPVPGVHTPMERDCISEKGNFGDRIAERALRCDPGLSGLPSRVDASNCVEQWWSDKCESRVEMTRRIEGLWTQVCKCDQPSCILVCHSNVIKVLAAHLSQRDLDSNDDQDKAELLRSAADRKLENAGVIGLRCVPRQPRAANESFDSQWVVEDAVLMFDTDFERSSQRRGCCGGKA